MRAAWRRFGGVFLTGLLTFLPALLTLYLVAWMVRMVERTFSKPLHWLVPEAYHAGMGIVLALALIFGLGLLMRAWAFRRIFRKVEKLFLEVPLVRSIYGSLRDFLGLFARQKEPALKVVAVAMPGTSWKLLGFVTRPSLSDLPPGLSQHGEVAVYFPMSYQIGGFTFFVPRECITEVDMSREDAMKFILTAGLQSQPSPAAAPVQPPGA